MTFSKFEKYAAGKIKNHSSEVDAEAIWNDILPNVPKDNSRWRGLIWFFSLGLIASFAVVFVLNRNEKPNSNNEITALSTLETINESIETQPLKTSEDVTANSTLEKQALQTPNLKPQTPNHKLQTTPPQTTQRNNSKADHQPEKYKAANTTQTQNPNQDIANKPFSPEPTASARLILTENNAEVIAMVENESPAVENSNQVENNEVASFDLGFSDSFETIETPALTQEIAEESTQPVNELSAEGENELPRRRNNFKIKYGFGLYGGLSSSFASLKDKDGMNPDYLQLRLETEEQLETMQFGLEAIAKSEVGAYFKTGLQYSRIARKFSLNSSLVTIDSVHGIQTIYVNSMGDSIFIYGSVPVTTTKTYNKVTYNYFHLMDIPVVLGYSYRNESWSFGVEAGALINISTKRKGEIMENQTEIYDIKEDRLGWFKDNVGVGFTASVMATYHLNENFQIYLAPTARLESVFSTDANPIDQKHGALGVNIGARYFIGY